MSISQIFSWFSYQTCSFISLKPIIFEHFTCSSPSEDFSRIFWNVWICLSTCSLELDKLSLKVFLSASARIFSRDTSFSSTISNASFSIHRISATCVLRSSNFACRSLRILRERFIALPSQLTRCEQSYPDYPQLKIIGTYSALLLEGKILGLIQKIIPEYQVKLT